MSMKTHLRIASCLLLLFTFNRSQGHTDYKRLYEIVAKHKVRIETKKLQLIEALEKTLESDPDNYRDYRIGGTQNTTKGITFAHQYLQKAKTPKDSALYDSAKHYYKKAKMFRESAQYDSAIIHYQKTKLLCKQATRWLAYVTACSGAGMAFRGKSDFNQAEKQYREALEAGLKYLGEEHFDIASIYSNMGTVFYDKGNYDQAINYHKKALDIRIKKNGKEHTSVASSYVNIGGVYSVRGSYDQAMNYFKKALDIQIKTLDEEGLPVATNYTNIGAVHQKKGSYEQALHYYKKALNIHLKIQSAEHPDLLPVYHNMGNIYQYKGNYERAMDYYQKVLAIQLNVFGEMHFDVAVVYNNIGTMLYDKGHYDQAMDYHRKALRIQSELLEPTHIDLANTYFNMGVVYDYKGDYNECLNYYKKALDILIKSLGPTSPKVALVYHNLGTLYDKKENYDQALSYYKKAMKIQLEVLPPIHLHVGANYLNMGVVYFNKGDYDQALNYEKKALEIYLELFGERHVYVAKNYLIIANSYRDKGDYDQALKHYNKTLEIQQKILRPQHPDLAVTYQGMGVLYQNQQDFKKALQQYQKALISLVEGFEDESIEQNPKLEKSSNELYLLRTLELKARSLEKRYHQQSKKLKDLRLSASTYYLAIQLIDQIKSGYKAEKSKLFFAEKATKTYKWTIQTTWQLYEITREDSLKHRVFDFVEKGKAGILREVLQESQARQFADIPDTLLSYEKKLKANLNYYEAEIQKREQGPEPYDTASVDTFRNRFFDLKKNYEALTERFEKDYPDYYQLKYDMSVRSVPEVQKHLADKHTALLEYTWGDSTLFVFAITKNTFNIFSLPVDSTLLNTLQQFKKDLYNSDILDRYEGNYKLYTQKAHDLYQTLLEPVLEAFAEQQIRRLTIVPDGPLQAFPFETLISSAVDTGTHHFAQPRYLIHDYSISYAYSATLLMQTKKRARDYNKGTCLAFAYSGAETANSFHEMAVNRQGDFRGLRQGDWTDLPGSWAELSAMARFVQGDYFYDVQASEKNFKEKATTYGLLHLALHGAADTNNSLNSRIVFPTAGDSTEDGMLHAWELYGMELNSDMAVLSACDMGIGQQIAGEGVMSLSRAFSYAGCPSVITSLWKVDDRTNPLIMTFFYEALSEGLSKDEALRQAKIRFIDQADRVDAHPYYWAAFINIGDSGPVALRRPLSYWWWIGAGSILFVAGLALLRKKKVKKKILVQTSSKRVQ